MYKVFLGELLLPVPPQKITTKINGNNKTMTLISGAEINQIKPAGLSDFDFSCLLPGDWYPFAQYPDGFQPPNYYLDQIENYKLQLQPFQFIVTRIDEDGTRNFETNITVTLEDYQITEDANNGSDLEVSIKLKQYIPYRTVVVDIPLEANRSVKITSNRSGSRTIPETYTVKKGDTLWAIAKKTLGDGAKCWNLAKLNGISNPNLIHPGQVLKIQDVAASKGTVKSTETTKKLKVSAPSLALVGAALKTLPPPTSVIGTLTGSTGYGNEGY